ncbi:MAG TPA: S41 family peptidase [Chloroflexota bacterium]|nr:S41 family peptidase [Chloroflexota bacterium]
MKFWRALVVLLVVCSGLLGQGVLQAPVAAAATPSLNAPLAAEDAPTQVRAFGEAYTLMLDHYVYPLDTKALLGAAWDQLIRDADGKAATPGETPDFTGDRAADLATMRAGLTAYLAQPNSSPEGFIAAHALIRGMVHFVDEGHTYFLDQEQYKDYQSWSRGDNTYVGIGISVSSRESEPRIVEVYDDTPAAQAGLQAGDILVRIGGKSVDGLALDEMTALVRGAAGTSVEIVVRRGTDPQELTFNVMRAEIRLQFVKQKLLEDDIGYVSLRGFPEPSVVDSIEQDVSKFQEAGVRGLVLDLRGNSGGRIDVGTRLLSDFLPAGTSVYEEIDRGGENSIHFSRAGSQYDLPLVVLVDGGTASMGEIFASAVQEHGAATILGTNTSGSVAAAQVFGLPDGSGLQVTVFEILSAGGKPLNKVGVVPDEVIEPDPADTAQGADPVLSRAIEILHDQSQSKDQPAGAINQAA